MVVVEAEAVEECLTAGQRALSAGLASWCSPLAVHDPAKVLLDLAVALGLGGGCLADNAPDLLKLIPDSAWTPACDADGKVREGARPSGQPPATSRPDDPHQPLREWNPAPHRGRQRRTCHTHQPESPPEPAHRHQITPPTRAAKDRD